MNRTYQKNIRRTLASSRGRFFAIFAIVALGVGFLAGLMSSTPDMSLSVETYLDDQNLYDLRVIGTLGLTEDDVSALRQVEGVQAVQPAYSADLQVTAAGADSVVARVHSLPAAAGDPEAPDTVNRLMLTEGRWPQTAGECVVEAGAGGLAAGMEIGDVILVAAEDNEDLADKLAVTEFTVVGTVHDATYFSFEREPASVGSGVVQTVFYILPQDFSYEAFTEIYLTVSGARELDSLGSAYEDTVAKVTGAVEGIAGARCDARYEELTGEAQQEIDDGWAEYYEAEEEAQTELADAAQELADGRQELADGEQELIDGEEEYQDGLDELNDYEQQLADGQAALNAGEAELAQGQAEWNSGWQQIAGLEGQMGDVYQQLQDAQKQYEDGLAQWQQGSEQLEQLKLLREGEDAYRAGVEQMAAQLNEQGLDVTADEIEQLIELLAAQGEFPTQEEFLALVLEWLTGLNDGEQEDAVGAVQGAAAAYARAEAEQGGPAMATSETAMATGETAMATSETAMAARTTARPSALPMAELEQAAEEGAESELWQQILDQLREMEDEIPDELKDEYEELIEALEKLEENVELTDRLQQMYEGVRQLVQARQQLDAGVQAIREAYAEMGQELTEEEARELYSAEGLAELQKQLDDGKKELDDGKKQLDDGWAQYQQYVDGRNELLSAKKTLDDGWATLADRKLQLIDAQQQIADARATLADARAELDEAWQTIRESTQELRDGEIEYADAKAEAERELADARAELADAQAQLDDLEPGEWYVWDRSRNVSFSSFDSNSNKLAALAKVFPVFFFLVAALVVSTTMTRMVEEERLQIGTMKALGYTQGAIMQKYILYALTAAAAGALFGLCVGFFVFPRVIWSAYSMMYWTPVFYAPWRWGVAAIAAGALLLCAMAATWSACRATLRETPAALMRPRAPKAGKRILLERVGFIWRRLPFTYKVTCRNLLRYKRRFWMTVIGVAGCTALLVTGFGISDSLDSIATRQFGQIYNYDLLTAVMDEQDLRQGPVYEFFFGEEKEEQIDSSMVIYTRQIEQEQPDGTTLDYYYMIPQQTENFADFTDLHERIGGEPTPIQADGVVLTEKMAATLGVQAGDSVTLDDGDGNTAQFTVTGVCEHYVFNYVYMSAECYARAFGQEPEWNAVMSRLADDSQQTRSAVSTALLAMDEVASLNFTQDTEAMVLNMLEAIDAVVVLIIVCAASLAFVVLYNLTNINIAERVKEIATIKVLGFYDREVDAYVNRESVALTLIGTALGLVAGIALHRFVILTVEVDAVMFGRDIRPLSFVYAFALTILFSTLVNLVMGHRLKHISMVESMKAPE